MTSLIFGKHRSRTRMSKLFRSSAVCGVIIAALTAQTNVAAQATHVANTATATITIANAQTTSDGGLSMSLTATATSPNRCEASTCRVFLTATCEAGPHWEPRSLQDLSVVTVHDASNGTQLSPGASAFTDPAFRTDPCPPNMVGPFVRAVYSSQLDYQLAGGDAAALSDVYYVGAPPVGSGTGLALAPVTGIAYAVRTFMAAGRMEEICLRLYPLAPQFPGATFSYAWAACQAAVFAVNYWQVVVFTIAVGGIAALLLLPSDPLPCAGPCDPRPHPNPAPAPLPTPAPNPDPGPAPCPGCNENPDPRVELLVQAMGSRTIGTKKLVADAQPDDNARRRGMARCLALLAAARLDPQKCQTDSIIFVGGLDAQQPAWHDLDTITLRPDLVELNYRNSDLSKVVQVCPVIDKSKQQCDEYPFKSSTQSVVGQVSFRAVDTKQNKREGDVLQGMYSRCGHYTAEASGENKPYLVVPLPTLTVVPTFYVCGGDPIPGLGGGVGGGGSDAS